MKPHYVFSDAERASLLETLNLVRPNPYRDYLNFMMSVASLIEVRAVPGFFVNLCMEIRKQRESGMSLAHVLRNCPIDPQIPDLDHDDPVADKYAKKRTFIGEAFLALFAKLAGTPLLSYGSRNNGDFFTDVVAINRYSGKQTGFSDSELMYHNDRTAHSVRADYVSLLGLRCPDNELIYTGFVDGRSILEHLSPEEQDVLRKPYFITPFDVFSRETNQRQVVSEKHPVLENEHSFRYYATTTAVAPGSPEVAKDALIAMMNALTKAKRERHRMLTGDLLVFANQDGLHNREKVEVADPNAARTRWLLKTYAFRDDAAAEAHSHKWMNDIRGLVAD